MASLSLVERIEQELDLLARTVDVLEMIGTGRPIGIVRLSERLQLPKHKTRYSLHLLEREGVILPSAEGAVVTDRASEFWEHLTKSLGRMSSVVQHLKERAGGTGIRSTSSRKV